MARKLLKKFVFIRQILSFLAIQFLFCTIIWADMEQREILIRQESETIRLSKIWNWESINQAITKLELIASEWEKNGDIPKTLFCLNEAAKLAQTISDYETASRILEKSLKISTNDNLVSEKVISLSLYALMSRQKGDTEMSRKYSEEAVKLSETTNTPLTRAYALLSAGIHSFYYGKIEKTKELLEKADLFAQQTNDSELINQALLFHGYAHGRDGNPAKGLTYMQSALQKSKESNYSRGQAMSLFGIGFMNMLLAEKQKAIVFFQEAEQLFPQDFEWLERAKLYNNFGVICEDFGQLNLAEIYREKAYLFYQKAKYPFGEIATLPSIARLKFIKGDFYGAKEIYEKTIILAKENKNEFYIAVAKEGLGDLNLNNGDHHSAIKYYREALDVYKNIGIKLPRLENNMGKAFEKKGDLASAKSLYNNALTSNFQIKDYLNASENLFNLAKLNFLEGNSNEAFEQIKQSIKITENLYSDLVNANLKRSYFSNVYDRYEFYIYLFMQKHKQTPDRGFALEALQASEKSRSRSMLESLRLSEADFVRDANPELIKREKEIRLLLNQNADRLTELLLKNTEVPEIAKIESETVSLENELEEIKAKLKENSPIYSNIKNPSAFDLSRFQQNVLDEKTLLLEFSLGEKESYLWLVSKNELTFYILPPENIIESRIEKIRRTFDSRQILPDEEVGDFQKRIAESENIFNQESRLLSKDLLGQITEKIANKRLIVVPDGKLALLPLSVLPLPDSDELLISRHEIVYEPSATFFEVLEKTNFQAKIPVKDLLIFADPVFSEIDARLTAQKIKQIPAPGILGLNLRDFRLLDANGKIPRLMATQEEADSIASTVGKWRTEIASGFTANRDRVLSEEIGNYRMIHFATHGLIDVERPRISGIVLSQFDQNGQKLEGFLRLQDIYSLNLASDLVVLSACQSGVGKEIKGEGMMSLNNAFLQAGAKTVLSSAWKVDDNATAELMKYFYHNLIKNNQTPSESLRLAQLELAKSEQFKSPFYWGAFMVQGEFRHPISTSSNYYFYLLPVIIVIGGIGAYFFWSRRKFY